MSENKTREIDLTILFFNFLYRAKKNIALILAIIILSIAGSFGLTYLKHKRYESKMIIISDILIFPYVKELVDDINLLITNQKFSEVAAKLNMTEDGVRDISYFDVSPVYEEKNLPLKDTEKGTLLIRVVVLNPESLPAVEKGITYYLETNQFVKVRIAQQQMYLEQIIAKLEKEISDLEALKTKIGTGTLLEHAQGDMMFDPTVVNTKIIELTKEKIRAKQSLELSNNLQVIEGFVSYSLHAWSKPSILLLSGFFFGFFVSMGLIIIIEINTGLKSYEETKQDNG